MPYRLIFKYLIFFALICFGYIKELDGQVDKEFWFAIPKETSSHGSITINNNVSFKITNQSDILVAHVEISMPANGTFTTRIIDIPPSQSYVEVLAESFAQFDDIYANPSPYNVTAVSGTTNRGIYIKSDNDITVYYDYDNYYNRDLFSLKGRNSLGTDFYLPFQNIWNNDTVPAKYTPDSPLSSANIVATEDGTIVTISPTAYVQGRGTNLSTYTVTLNKGETYSMVAGSRTASGHLSGTHVTSNKPIAITINDDSVPVDSYSCYDILGDQIIPTTVIGTKYLVMTGDASTSGSPAGVQQPERGEQIIVTGTKPGTQVYFYARDGLLLYNTTINTGGTTYFTPDINDDNQTSIYVSATNPVYVFHITGIGCEMGGAILPPITNCTGSNEVSFFRSSIADDGSSSMTLNLMIPYDKNLGPSNWDAVTQSHHFFTVYYQDGTSKPIPHEWFEPVDSAGWVVLAPNYRGNAGIGTLIPINQAVKIVNEKDFFHLGITNGYSGQTNKYGYFSSFNATVASAVVASVNETAHISCFGDTVHLQAAGGLEYTWHYGATNGPPTYLSNPKASTPRVFCPPGVHDFYVVVRQSKCFGDDTLKVTVRVLPEVKAGFKTDTTGACAPFNVNFTNESKGATKYEWSYRKDNDPPIVFVPPSPLSFREPASGSFQNNTSPYKPLIYTYKLRASYFGECPDTATKQIIVYPTINANFFPKDTTSCNPTEIKFRNMSNGNVADSLYQWNFGDGSSSPDKNPFHKFENRFKATDTVYNVNLVATSPFYCRDTARATVRVYPFIEARFTVDTVRGCSPLTIKITNNSLNKKAIQDFIWDFGDGTIRIVNKDTLMHTYPINTSANPANYKLLLTVKHQYSGGCPDTISRNITVYPQSTISFLTNPGANAICDSTNVNFFTTASPAITSYLWEFGDGNTSTSKNPSHLFTNLTTSDKTYHVKLTGMSNEYCNGYAYKDITVHAFLDPQIGVDANSFCAPFDANIKNKSRGGIVSYKWTYGDGTPPDYHSVIDTTHRYYNSTKVIFAPTIKLVVANSGGCKDSIEQSIKVYPQIKADFRFPQSINCNPFSVTFKDSSTYPNVVSKYYEWDFGDGNTSADREPEHTFNNYTSAIATYPVKLTVTSDQNCTSTITRNISVYPYIEAIFSVDSVKGCSPFPVQIINSSKGSVTQYLWEYEPGNVAVNSSSNFIHTYTNTTTVPSNRYLKLIASNTNGQCTSRDSILLTIYPEVNSLFTTNVIEGCNPLEIQYTNRSGPGSVPVEWNWIFGDGATDNIKRNTTHTFRNLTANERTFTTKLISTSIYKCSDTSSMDITVYPFIDADFSFPDAEGCSPKTVTITNNSSPGVNGYYWIFDDNQTSTVSAPIFNHIYRNTGTSTRTFMPKLVVNYNGQCHDTATQSLQVYPEVTAMFEEDTLKGCHPFHIDFTNLSRNATYYDWKFGDRGTSSKFQTDHTYYNFSNVDSVYTITLKARSTSDCESSITKQVTVYPKPKAIIDLEDAVDCPPFAVKIDNLSEAGDFYTYTFGDGESLVATDLSSVTHVYDNHTPDIATYNLNLFVQSIYNCTNEITQSIDVFPRVLADFTPDTSGCSPLYVPMKNNTVRAVTYKWDFGDGFSSPIRNPNNTFYNDSMNDTTFNVRMIGFSEFGCSDTAFRQVLVHPQPEVGFKAQPKILFYPDARLNLANETNEGYWNYLWNFDDGQTSALRDPVSHEYLRWGSFNVSLKAWSDYCSDSASIPVKVKAPKTIADFDASQNGCEPLSVDFTNHSTWATSYEWNFDDGSTSTEINPSHIYKDPGKYQVKLTTYGDGEEDVTYREVEVYAKPKVRFDLSPKSPNVVMLPDALVQFYNTSEGGNRYLWDFGDGDTSSVFEPTHTYQELGIYDVTLSVWTEHQCFDSINLQDAVIVEGKGLLVFPNAFTPSIEGPSGGSYTLPDVQNIIFHPYHDGVETYKLEIYDRWGELLFESNDVNIGWDGYYKGNLCKSDVYIWKAKGKFYNGSTFNKAGDVTLLR